TDRKKECLPRESTELSLEFLLGVVRNVTEKAEGQMHLCGRKPPHAAHFRIQSSKDSGNEGRKLDADEESFFRVHSCRLNSQPESDALLPGPSGTCAP